MNLYRRSTLQASLALLLASVVGFTTLAAQRRKPHKLRATALVEFVREPSGATTQRLVPITILDDGTFHDANLYKSTPEPMALGSGVVYEAQKTGQVMGYFTVNRATRSANLWTAQGRWQPPAPPKTQSAASSGSTAKSVDERPILHHGGSTSSAQPQSGASPTPDASSTQGTSSSSGPSDDRPVIRRSSTDNAPASTPTPAPAAAPSPSPTSAASAPEPESDDPNRPTLRHRAPGSAKPVEVLPESTPTPVAATPATTPKPAPASSSPVAVQQTLVAVSDAQQSEPRSYDFVWKAGEFEVQEGKMRRLALTELARESGEARLTEKSLGNVVIRGFDLDLSNEPVMVLSAEIPPAAGAPTAKPAPRAGTKTAGAAKSSSATSNASATAARATRYLTLIARVDAEGEPQKLAASLTDSSRLDVAPRLELIDAVDVDGDGLAELLFREYNFDEKSFVIFSIGRTTVAKLFEGASQPLN